MLEPNCVSCRATLSASWSYCPFCGKSVSKSAFSVIKEEVTSKEIKIAERFLLLANDYNFLTGHKLEGIVLQNFLEHPVIGQLSVVEGNRRLQAGRNVRKSLGERKFSLDLDEWLEAVYDLHSPDSNSRVWITDGGTKYHASRECQGMKSGQEYARWKGKETYNPQFIPIRRAAFVLGLTPCLVCKPKKYDGN